MNVSIQALREQRQEKAKALHALVNDNKEAAAKWTAEHQTSYDDLSRDIDGLDAQVKRIEDSLARTAAATTEIERIADATGQTLGHTKAEEEKRMSTFRNFLRNGYRGLTQDEILASRPQNAQAEGTPSAGGYLVPTTTVARLLMEMKFYGGMRQVSQIIQTGSGETMQWPTVDDTGNIGEIVAENAAAAAQDLVFGQVALVPYKFSSKVFAVPFELLQDSVIDVASLVEQMAGVRIGRAENLYFTTGSGAAQPRGVVTAAVAGKVGLVGETLSVIYDDIIDLEHSVDPEYRPGASFMFHDSTLQVLKKLKDSQGRPLWLPGLSAAFGIAPPTINGYPYQINQQMPVMAANAKSILFGQFGRYIIRDVMQMQLFRFDDSTYIKNGQIGFLMWARCGGNFIAPSGNSMKYFANSAT